MPTKTQITVTQETIDPDTASAYLEKNVDNNRPVREWKVNRYAVAMQEGRWLATSSTIKFDSNDALIDGQHRLRAIVEAGVPVDTMVSRGEDPKSIFVIDTNTPRSAADSLVVAGMSSRTSGTQLAGLANAMNGWENGLYAHAMDELGNADRFTPDEVVEYVRMHDAEMEAALAIANHTMRMVPLNRSGLAVAYMVLSRISKEGADDFFHRLAEGILSGADDPLVALTRKAQAERLQPNRKNLVGTTLYLVFRTWNAWRKGEPLGKFQYGSRNGGWTLIPKPV